MQITSLSLLDRLRQYPSPDDWRRLHDLYHPLIRVWLARVPGLGSEADDVAQEVMIVVLREVVEFERQREGSFRKWLRLVTVNRVRQFLRERARRPQPIGDGPAADFLARLADPSDDLAREWDRDHDRHVFDRLLDAVRPGFAPATWEAFRRFAIDGRPASEVAGELGITPNAVVLAKARVLSRLREEAGALIE